VSPAGTLLITDEVANAIFEYSGSGSYIRTIVDSSQGIDRPYGIEVVGEWISHPGQRETLFTSVAAISSLATREPTFPATARHSRQVSPIHTVCLFTTCNWGWR
jgi:hypothetical protein